MVDLNEEPKSQDEDASVKPRSLGTLSCLAIFGAVFDLSGMHLIGMQSMCMCLGPCYSSAAVVIAVIAAGLAWLAFYFHNDKNVFGRLVVAAGVVVTTLILAIITDNFLPGHA